MKKQYSLNKKCKYHILKIGFLYAVLSLLFSIWEIYYILTGGERVSKLLVPFFGLLLCLVSGILLMLKDRRKYIRSRRKPQNSEEQVLSAKEYYV
ncbi:hypothetical protein [Anaerocolumna chitinilytica]|uniref:Uncharacterized protein n=1 Tax=Anaerocolumna chitinilytica TaxID=1727145 RepID=A0A7I8DMQ8_9FIRM|nr:hypothetical protein [Anaerocolumna chitinilytica]BCJ99713.1 hypothetical protein bsdcttw_27540 [Anaerocolumna chitinilytica]